MSESYSIVASIDSQSYLFIPDAMGVRPRGGGGPFTVLAFRGSERSAFEIERDGGACCFKLPAVAVGCGGGGGGCITSDRSKGKNRPHNCETLLPHMMREEEDAETPPSVVKAPRFGGDGNA